MRIQAGGYDYGRVAFAPPNQQTMQFVEQYNQHSLSNLSSDTLARMEELQQAQMSLTQYTDSRLLEHIHGQTQGHTLGKLGYYTTLETLQSSEVRDVRWIMSHPTLQKLYQQGIVEGYGEDYVEIETYLPPDERRDFLLANHGIMDRHGKVSKYQDTMMQSGDRLNTSEKQNWCDMEGIIDELLLDNKDPSSRYGNEL